MDAISDVSRGSEIFSSVPVFPPLPQPLNLDDLFGFSEAGRKKLVEEIVETKYFVVNKIFINQVDSFTGKHILSMFKGKNYKLIFQGVLKDEANQDESEEASGIVHEGGKRTKSCCVQIADKIQYPLLKETVEDLEGSIQEETCPHDMSKLTVAEYYDMLELESIENRDEFIKDKLGKFYVDPGDDGFTNKELEYFMQDQTTNPDIQENVFEIVGTLKNNKLECVDGVTELIRTTYDDPEFLDQLLTCGIIIYCVNEDLDQTMEATWALNSIINFINENKDTQNFTGVCSPIFILVSTFMTWSFTKPLSLSEELPFIETDYRKRKPHPNYKTLFELEEQLIKALHEHLIKSAIIVSGIPYGHEENELRFLFEKAYWYKHVPIYSNGKNLIPTVHVENLANIVIQTLRNIDCVTTPFIFAKEPAQNTMADISKALSSSFGTGFCEFQHKEFAFINDMVSQDLYSKITSNLFLESCYPLFKEEDICWKYESGFTENINHIVEEFIDADQIEPLRVIFYGISLSDRLKDIALKISKCCHIPYKNPKSIVSEYIDEVFEKQAKVEERKLLSTSDKQNLNDLSSINSPPELILCEDDKCIEDELEILRNLNIDSYDEAKRMQESENVDIVARKLKMRPYAHHGYILEEYPQNLVQANLMFYERAETKSTILPNFVIVFNLVRESKDQEMRVWSRQLQASEEYDFGATDSKFSGKEILINNINQASYAVVGEEEDNMDTDVEKLDETVNIVGLIDDDMLAFFSNLDEKCLVITLDIEETDDEDEIFRKTLNIIQRNYPSYDQDVIDSSSVNEQFESVQHVSEVDNVNDISPNSKLRNSTERIDTEELKEAEEVTLAVKSYPLLSYLINVISPTVTNAILDLTAQMPQDPIDFIAEYIFKNNPDGRMMPQNELKLEELLSSQKIKAPQIDSKACLA